MQSQGLHVIEYLQEVDNKLDEESEGDEVRLVIS